MLSVLIAAQVVSFAILYYVDLCEACTVITAIHIRFITPVEIESLEMERNVFEYPLASNKSELTLRYYYYSGRASAELMLLVQ